MPGAFSWVCPKSLAELHDQRIGRWYPQKIERGQHDPLLQSWFVRPSERISQWPVNGEYTRRPDALGDFGKQGDRNGGNSGLLNDALNQSDRLVAHRSYGCEKDSVHGVFVQLACDFRRAERDQSSWRGDRSHDTEMPGRRLADGACHCQFPQTVQRKRKIAVGLNSGVVKGVALDRKSVV